MKKRKSSKKRKTKETSIAIEMCIDGQGKYSINTQVPFLTHMLEQISRHSLIDMKIKATGDSDIDAHHITEDIGITLGDAIQDAIGNKKGIKRFGFAYGVMDEALARVALDFSGRPYLNFNLRLSKKRIGNFDTELVEEFFQGFSRGAKMTLHIDGIKGGNTHHSIEAVFKGFALALRDAVNVQGKGLPSTKGSL